MKIRQYKIPPDKREALYKRGIQLADNIFTDKLDSRIGLTRVKTRKTPDEVLQMCLEREDKAHWAFIERLSGWTDIGYFDLGCCTFGDPDYFLWIELDIPNAEILIKEFDLQEK